METQTFTTIEKLEPYWPKNNTVSSPFQTYLWNYLWIKHFGDNLDLKFIVYLESKTLLAIIPLYMKDNTLQLIGIPPNVTDYMDIIWLTKDKEFQNKILTHFLETYHQYTLNLMHLSQDSPTNFLLQNYEKKPEPVPKFTLPTTWEKYLELLGKKNRHELRRKLKKIEEVSFELSYFSKPTEITDTIDIFINLMKASSPEKDTFMNETKIAFFKEFALAMAKDNLILLSFLTIDNVKIASTLYFNHQNKLLLYNSGYNPEYRDISPGFLLTALNIKYAIENKFQLFDFLRGDERYKYQLGGKERSIYNILIKL